MFYLRVLYANLLSLFLTPQLNNSAMSLTFDSLTMRIGISV
ncbi:hypothetical protein GOY07_00045 [Wolbachia endosymbiont of Litomosoides sigmodontis]|nr:hypothetical protein GOY07_00045 [Wolbachia endosymbiont of Litomosoides sigmodontis]